MVKHSMAVGSQHPDLLAPLNERELEILRLIDEGLSNRDIANRLFLSLDTIKWYTKNLYSKLGVNSRTQAIARARQLHLFSSNAPSSTAHLSHHFPAQPNHMTEWSAARLPFYTTPFVGRDKDASYILVRLRDPHCRLLTLVGHGGIGKTRLAVEAARLLLAAEEINSTPFADGIRFIDLQSVSTTSELVTALANALKILISRVEPARDQLLRYLSEHQMLMILDNFEQLLGSVDILVEVLHRAPSVKFLVTSRERLNIQEEWTLRVDGLNVPEDRATDPLETYSAVQLFAQRAKQAQANFSVSENANAVTAICQHVEGMPLGLELAASWLRAMSCEQIAWRIANSLDFLTTPLHNIPERHRSLRAVFEQSWSLLALDEQKALAQLCIFRGGIDLEAAEQVVGASLALLARLADKAFIRLNADGRYDLHELLRQYASDKLTDDEAHTTANRHLAYFAKIAEQAEAHQYGPHHKTWFDRLDRELNNIRAALAWSLDGGIIENGLRIAATLRFYWEYRGHDLEGFNWLERLLAVDQEVSHAIRAKALERAGDLAINVTSGERARALCSEALILARQINDQATIAWTLSDLGRSHLDHGPLSEAAAPLDESLALFRKLDDPSGLSHALRRRAWVAYELKDYAYAQLHAEEALMHAREVGDQNAVAQSLHILGRILFCLDYKVEDIAPLFEESASLLQDLDEGGAAHLPIVLLGDIERSMGHFLRAQALYQQALMIMPDVWNHQLGLLAHTLAGLAMLPNLQEETERVVCLLGAMERCCPGFDEPVFCPVQTINECVLSLQEKLGEAAFRAAWAKGYRMMTKQVIAYALQPPEKRTS